MTENYIKKNNANLLYEQIMSFINDKIESGKWPVTHKLKAEDVLARALSVSRGTVRKAIKRLVKKGILVQIHGKGTFVTSSKIKQPPFIKLKSYADVIKDHGIIFKTEVIERKEIFPPQNIKSRLEIEGDEKIFFLKRVRSTDNCRIMLIDNYVRVNLCPGLEKVNFAKETLFNSIENISNISISWAKRTVSALAADSKISKYLDIEKNSPILFFEQITYDNNDTIFETSDIWVRGDSLSFTSIIKK